MSGTGKKAIAVILVGVLLAADRWLKDLALAGIDRNVGLFHFSILKNYGIIFSWPLPAWMALLLMLLALIVVGWLLVRHRQDGWRAVGLLLLFAGAASNLYDRFVHGFIVDWADFGRWWPVFNLADVMIFFGVIIFVWPKNTVLPPAPPPIDKNP